MGKPEVVKTLLRDMIILPPVGSTEDVYNGKVFSQEEINPEMTSKFPIIYQAMKLTCPAWYGCHSLPPLRSPQVVMLTKECQKY